MLDVGEHAVLTGNIGITGSHLRAGDVGVVKDIRSNGFCTVYFVDRGHIIDAYLDQSRVRAVRDQEIMCVRDGQA